MVTGSLWRITEEDLIKDVTFLIRIGNVTGKKQLHLFSSGLTVATPSNPHAGLNQHGTQRTANASSDRQPQEFIQNICGSSLFSFLSV